MYWLIHYSTFQYPTCTLTIDPWTSFLKVHTCPNRHFHTLPWLLDSWAALPNFFPNACVPSREAVCTIFMVFGMTWPGGEATSYRAGDGQSHATHLATTTLWIMPTSHHTPRLVCCTCACVYDKTWQKSRLVTNIYSTVEPLLWGHPFCIRKVAFQEGWPLVRGRNQYVYV